MDKRPLGFLTLSDIQYILGYKENQRAACAMMLIRRKIRPVACSLQDRRVVMYRYADIQELAVARRFAHEVRPTVMEIEC